MKSKLEKQIERALMSHFKGLKCSIKINHDGSYNFQRLSGSKLRFDEMYPAMTTAQADRQIIVDMENIIREYLPDTRVTNYERYGKLHRI